MLDTNIVLPLICDRLSELPRSQREMLLADLSRCTVSTASLWEMAIKQRLGKLTLPCPEQALPELCEFLGLHLLPVTPGHATTPLSHWPETNDPFDRILLSICEVEGLRLLTTDRALADHPLAWRA